MECLHTSNGTTTQTYSILNLQPIHATKLVPMNAHQNPKSDGPAELVQTHPIPARCQRWMHQAPFIHDIHPTTNSSAQKTIVPKAWRAETVSWTGWRYHLFPSIAYSQMIHRTPSMIPAGTSTARTTLSMLLPYEVAGTTLTRNMRAWNWLAAPIALVKVSVRVEGVDERVVWCPTIGPLHVVEPEEEAHLPAKVNVKVDENPEDLPRASMHCMRNSPPAICRSK